MNARPNMSFKRLVMNPKYTGCSLFSLLNMQLRCWSLLDAQNHRRQSISAIVAREYDNERWEDKCKHIIASVIHRSLQNNSNNSDTVAFDEAWLFLNTIDDNKPELLQKFNDHLTVQHQNPYCIEALNYLLEIASVNIVYFRTCVNDCDVNIPDNNGNNENSNVIQSTGDNMLIWNPSNTSVGISLKSVVTEARAVSSQAKFAEKELKQEESQVPICNGDNCTCPLLFYKTKYEEPPDQLWLSLGFFTNETDGSKSARAIHSLQVNIDGLDYVVLCQVSLSILFLSVSLHSLQKQYILFGHRAFFVVFFCCCVFYSTATTRWNKS